MNQNEFDALVSLVFNIGAGAFKNSTVRKRLNRNDRIGAADAIGWWNKATISAVLREVRRLSYESWGRHYLSWSGTACRLSHP